MDDQLNKFYKEYSDLFKKSLDKSISISDLLKINEKINKLNNKINNLLNQQKAANRKRK